VARQIKKLKPKKREKIKTDTLSITEKLFVFLGKNIKAFLCFILALIIISVGIGGFWYAKSQSDKMAAERFSKALAIYWQNDETQKVSQNKYIKALQNFQSIINDYPNTKYADWSLVYIGNCNLNLKNYPQAIEAYDKYIHGMNKTDIFTIDAYRGIGVAYIEEGKYSMALKVYKEFMNLSKELLDEKLLWDMGRCYEKTGDEKSAMKFYKKILDEYPNSFFRREAEKKVKILGQMG